VYNFLLFSGDALVERYHSFTSMLGGWENIFCVQCGDFRKIKKIWKSNIAKHEDGKAGSCEEHVGLGSAVRLVFMSVWMKIVRFESFE